MILMSTWTACATREVPRSIKPFHCACPLNPSKEYGGEPLAVKFSDERCKCRHCASPSNQCKQYGDGSLAASLSDERCKCRQASTRLFLRALPPAWRCWKARGSTVAIIRWGKYCLMMHPTCPRPPLEPQLQTVSHHDGSPPVAVAISAWSWPQESTPASVLRR